MADDLRVKAVEGAGRVCSYCREGVAEEEPSWECSACRSVLHAACRQELGSCPTLGCAGSEALDRRRSRRQEKAEGAAKPGSMSVGQRLTVFALGAVLVLGSCLFMTGEMSPWGLLGFMLSFFAVYRLQVYGNTRDPS